MKKIVSFDIVDQDCCLLNIRVGTCKVAICRVAFCTWVHFGALGAE